MISKLDLIGASDNVVDRNGFVKNVANAEIVVKKINEIIDWINHNNHEYESIEDVLKASEEKDKFAKQRKWIGKLCKFRDYDGEGWWYGILANITEDEEYPYWLGDWEFAECEAVTEEEFKDMIYKEGQ